MTRLTPDEAEQRWRMALHEAAHAYCGHLLGGAVSEVYLAGGGGRAWIGMLDALSLAVVSAAGRCGERLAGQFAPPGELVTPFEPPDDDQADQRKAAQDHIRVYRWAATGLKPNPRLIRERRHTVAILARGLVNAHAAQIVHLADALYRRGQLEREDIQRIIAPETNAGNAGSDAG